MNETARSNILPIFGIETTEPAIKPVRKMSWWTRRALDVRVKTMPNTPPPPIVNWTAIGVAFSFITVLILVAGLLCGAAWYMSAQNSEIQQLRKEIDGAKLEAKQAKDISLDNKSQTEPTPDPTPTPRRK